MVEREWAPEFLGEVARIQLSVRFMAQDVTGLLDHVGLQPHSKQPWPQWGDSFSPKVFPYPEGWHFSLGSQQSSSPTQKTLGDDPCVHAQSRPTLL